MQTSEKTLSDAATTDAGQDLAELLAEVAVGGHPTVEYQLRVGRLKEVGSRLQDGLHLGVHGFPLLVGRFEGLDGVVGRTQGTIVKCPRFRFAPTRVAVLG